MFLRLRFAAYFLIKIYAYYAYIDLPVFCQYANLSQLLYTGKMRCAFDACYIYLHLHNFERIERCWDVSQAAISFHAASIELHILPPTPHYIFSPGYASFSAYVIGFVFGGDFRRIYLINSTICWYSPLYEMNNATLPGHADLRGLCPLMLDVPPTLDIVTDKWLTRFHTAFTQPPLYFPFFISIDDMLASYYGRHCRENMLISSASAIFGAVWILADFDASSIASCRRAPTLSRHAAITTSWLRWFHAQGIAILRFRQAFLPMRLRRHGLACSIAGASKPAPLSCADTAQYHYWPHYWCYWPIILSQWALAHDSRDGRWCHFDCFDGRAIMLSGAATPTSYALHANLWEIIWKIRDDFRQLRRSSKWWKFYALTLISLITAHYRPA